MIEALVGSVIAVIATGALALMAEVFVQSRGIVNARLLSPYEKEVISVVLAAREDPRSFEELESQVEDWLVDSWNQGL